MAQPWLTLGSTLAQPWLNPAPAALHPALHQLAGRTIRVDHCRDYRHPDLAGKDNDKDGPPPVPLVDVKGKLLRRLQGESSTEEEEEEEDDVRLHVSGYIPAKMVLLPPPAPPTSPLPTDTLPAPSPVSPHPCAPAPPGYRLVTLNHGTHPLSRTRNCAPATGHFPALSLWNGQETEEREEGKERQEGEEGEEGEEIEIGPQ